MKNKNNSLQRFLSLIFLLLLVINCNTNTNKIVQEKYYENGELHSGIRSNGNDTLTYKEYFENGILKKIGSVDINGTRIGKWKYYNNNHGLIATGSYERGSKIGLWKYEKDSISWSIFSDDSHSFRLNYPSNWTVKSDTYTNLVSFQDTMSTGGFIKNFNVATLDESNELSDLAKKSLQDLIDYLDEVNIIKDYQTIINENESLIVELNVMNKDILIFAWQVFIEKKDFVLVLNFFSTTRDIRLFNEISHSVFLVK